MIRLCVEIRWNYLIITLAPNYTVHLLKLGPHLPANQNVEFSVAVVWVHPTDTNLFADIWLIQQKSARAELVLVDFHTTECTDGGHWSIWSSCPFRDTLQKVTVMGGGILQASCKGLIYSFLEWKHYTWFIHTGSVRTCRSVLWSVREGLPPQSSH